MQINGKTIVRLEVRLIAEDNQHFMDCFDISEDDDAVVIDEKGHEEREIQRLIKNIEYYKNAAVAACTELDRRMRKI